LLASIYVQAILRYYRISKIIPSLIPNIFTSIDTIHNNNRYTDTISFWSQVKKILFLTIAKSSPSTGTYRKIYSCLKLI